MTTHTPVRTRLLAMAVGVALTTLALVAGPAGPASADGALIDGWITAPTATDAEWWRGVDVQLTYSDGTVVAVTGLTSAAGAFAFSNVQAGQYRVTAHVSGYVVSDVVKPVNLMDASTDLNYVNSTAHWQPSLVLVPGGTVSGHITTPAGTYGNWWQGATVNLLTYNDYTLTWSVYSSTKPDSSGNYLFIKLPLNVYSVQVLPSFLGLDNPSQQYALVNITGATVVVDFTVTASAGYTLINQVAPTLALGGLGTTIAATCGTWAPVTPTCAYAWKRDGILVRGTASSYTFGLSDRGHTFTVVVTATKTSYVTASATSDGFTLPLLSFAATGEPTISGGTGVGDTLTVDPGAWSPNPAFTYRWIRDDAKIDGASASTYVLTPADLGHTMSVEVTGSTTGYAPQAADSAGLSIPLGTFSAAPAPTVSGVKGLGDTLTANPGTWSPSATLTYQWYRNGTAIAGATKSAYKLTSSDSTKSISVAVTGAALGYATATMTSTGLAMPKFFTKTPTPTITGTLRAGYTLTAHRGTWSPTPSYSYQWYRNGAAISKATKSTYKLTASDKGKKITVRVTAKKSGYGTDYKTSAAKTIYLEFSKAPTPTVTGTAKAGHTLTAHAGTWSPTPALTYQWYRNGTKISGATKSTYKLTSKDKGKKITVKVTGKRTGYYTRTKTSAAKTVAK